MGLETIVSEPPADAFDTVDKLCEEYGINVAIHNHPSGDPSPSRADEMVTRRLVEAATLMQVRFLDHVIIGKPSPGRTAYYSFREAGLVP